VNIDERAETWRKEGWTGTAGVTDRSSAMARDRPLDAARSSSNEGEQVVPVTEEPLRVGKRQVSHGRVRIRTYVVETPVQENVNLREEHVQVERRPVDRSYWHRKIVPGSGDRSRRESGRGCGLVGCAREKRTGRQEKRAGS
jgi:Domain of unknown function (DUF2382)